MLTRQAIEDRLTEAVAECYVTDGHGRYLIQLPDPDSQWGFSLEDDDQSWDGGIGSGCQAWTAVPAAEVPTAVRERLGWILGDRE